MVGVLEKVSGAIEILERVVAELEPETFDGPHAADLLQQLAVGERLCAAAKTLMVRRVDDSRLWRREGHRSAAVLACGDHRRVGRRGHRDACDGVGTRCVAVHRERVPRRRVVGSAGQRDHCRGRRQPRQRRGAARARPILVVQGPARSVPRGARLGSRRCRTCSQVARVAPRSTAGPTRTTARIGSMSGCIPRPVLGSMLHSVRRSTICSRKRAAAGRREPYAATPPTRSVVLVCGGPTRPVDVKLTVDHAAMMRGHTEPGETCTIDGIGSVPVSAARVTARRCTHQCAGTRRHRDHHRDVAETNDPCSAASGARSPVPGVRSHRLQQRPVPADRPHRADRARWSDEPREHVAHLHALSRSQDVLAPGWSSVPGAREHSCLLLGRARRHDAPRTRRRAPRGRRAPRRRPSSTPSSPAWQRWSRRTRRRSRRGRCRR